MAFPSSGARKSQWTPRWFAPSREKGEPDLGVPTSAERQSLQHGDGRRGGILNSVVITLGPVSSSWRQKLAGGSPRKPLNS